MIRRIALGLLWIGFIVYAFGFAPPNQPDTAQQIINMTTFQLEGINPLVFALFNTLGLVPMLYACFLIADGRGQKIPASVFVMLSFGVGAFALLPYLALRAPNDVFLGEKNALIKVLDSRWTGALLALLVVGLLSYGAIAADWQDFVQQFQTSRFVHVMSLDFCLLTVLFPVVLRGDMARRGLTDPRIFWAVTGVPLLGALVYLLLRPAILTQPPAPNKPPAGTGFQVLSPRS